MPCSGQGCGRGWTATGDQSQDEWAQYWDLWGATDPQPLQQGSAIDHHWGPNRGRDVTKAGMHVTMVHSLGDVLKQLGVSAFNRRGRLPLYGLQSIVCFSTQIEKVVFCEGPDPLSCGGFFPPQPAVSISWMDLADMVYMFVCGWRGGGGAPEEESSPLSHIARGEHTQHITREHLVGGMCTWCQMIVQR